MLFPKRAVYGIGALKRCNFVLRIRGANYIEFGDAQNDFTFSLNFGAITSVIYVSFHNVFLSSVLGCGNSLCIQYRANGRK